jgi:hypothetical protein
MVFEEALGEDADASCMGLQQARFAVDVNLNTIREVKQPRSAEEIVKWSTLGSPGGPGCSPRRRSRPTL